MDRKKKKKIERIAKRKASFVARPIQRYITNKQVNMNDHYARYYEDLEIIENTILFEVRDGQSFTDSPYAMYRQMVDDVRFENFTFYWVYSEKVSLTEVMANLPKIKNTKFVLRNSNEYLRLLASVQYLITNSTFQSFYTKKEGQIYINTWHGTPLKTMGFDIPDNPFASQNVLRNFLMADYLISPNAHTTNMYLKSYKLDGLYDGQILESGYPRIDLTFNVPEEEVYAKLKLADVELDFNRQTILYTPTWKGKNLSNPELDMEQMISELTFIRESVSEKYNFLVKVHPFVYPFVKERDELQGILVPDSFDANEMMRITDILITDYSSIFFDFLATGKTILFYSWDKDLYSHDRGMYYQESELPGPVLSTVEEVVLAIQNIEEVNRRLSSNYKRMQELMVPYDDGHATERYIDAIFFEKKSDKITYPVINNNKYRIILFPSTLKDNGITTSAINLLNNIDYDRYDVTVICQNLRNEVALKNLGKINKNARIIFRFGWPIYKMEEIYTDQLLKNRSVTKELERFYPKSAYQREMRRLTGCSHFNVSVDFSGYSYYWAKFMLEVDADRKVIYQHNDLHAEAKARYFIDLRGTFSLYKWFDVLLSVSPTTRDVNRAKLSEYAAPEKFQYCINTIDTARILDGAPEIEPINENDLHLTNVKKDVFVRQYGVQKFIPDLTKLDETVSHEITEDDQLLAIMSGYRNGHKYFKVLVNNIYYGWLPAINLTEYSDNTLEIDNHELSCDLVVANTEVIHKTAVLTCPKGYDIYNELSDIADHCVKGSARLLQGLNVNVVKKATVKIVDMVKDDNENHALEELVTEYYQCEVNHQLIGWINKDAFVEIDSLAENSQLLEQLALQLNGSYEVHRMFNLNTSELYLRPQDILSGKTINIECDNVMVEALRAIVINGEHYYHVIANNAMINGWVSQDNVIPVEAAERTVIENKSISEDVCFTKSEVPMYATMDDYYESLSDDNLEDSMHFVRMEVPVQATRYIRLLQTVLIEIIDEFGEHYYVEPQYLEPAPEEGAFTNIHGEVISSIREENINFVTMGRLSPEKNQESLIKGVAKLLEEHSELRDVFRLYMMGDGPLKEKLIKLVEKLSLENNVIMLGQKEHPFDIMKQCDCFILPSLYEGQPMVLLEALTLGMDTIASDIPSNRFVLEEGEYGLLIDGTDPEPIATTIYQYINEDHKFKHFNYAEYNKEAIQNFYDEI